MALALVTGIEISDGRWVLATDVQKYYRCLPFNWYLVTNLGETGKPRRGDLVQFRAPEQVERLTDSYRVIKIVAGVAGDRWSVEENRLYLNGQEWGEMFLREAIGEKESSLKGEGVIPEGHVFVLGTNPSSYDSRYWGALPIENIEGRAHVLF